MAEKNANAVTEANKEGKKTTKANKGEVEEFIGPVKIIMVEPKAGNYTRKTWGSAFVTMAAFSIGASIFPILCYTLSFQVYSWNVKNLHILLCTIGFQLLIPTAFLLLNAYNGAANVLKERHRKLLSLLLKFGGFLCVGSGIVCVMGDLGRGNLHAFTGMLAGALAALDVLGTPCLLLNRNNIFARFGSVMGIPSFLMSSACFVLGILSDGFKMWAPVKSIVHITIVFCVYYSVVVAYDPLRRLFYRI